LLTFSCHDTPLGVVNFKSDEKSDRWIDIFQPIRMLHFEEIFHKIDTPRLWKIWQKIWMICDIDISNFKLVTECHGWKRMTWCNDE
jgi:hypothetical protein